MLQFELPWAFLMLPLPLIVYLLTPEFRDSGEAVRAPFFHKLAELTGQTPQSGAFVLRKGLVQKANIIATWILIVVALANPVWLGEPIVQEKSARDLLLIVDLSGSMDEADFTNSEGQKVSRIDAVKEVLHEFVAARKTDRIGLAVFGNAAFPQAPFTEDHQTVLALLDELQTGMAGPKTMIGDAIGLAVRLFEPSKSQNKVAILLTDGNDSGSQMPVPRAVEIAAENEIQIHTIAMGDPTTAGEKELDTETLKGMSDTTGGQYFLAMDREQLVSIYETLDKLETQKLETISYRPKLGLFQYPIALMVLCNVLLAALMLFSSSRRRQVNV